MDSNEEIFTDVPHSPSLQLFLDTLLRVRRDLYVDPTLTAPWSCDPKRCRPRLGENLCCKVETRCPNFENDRCSVHSTKPFSCALFPLDLVRVRGLRVVTTVKNLDFFHTGWSRYDRDMLSCFQGVEVGHRSMFETQSEVLQRVFTRSEMLLMEQRLRALREGDLPTPTQDPNVD